MKHKLILVFTLMMMILSVAAQTDSGVIVHKDNRIELLLKKQIAINYTNNNNNTKSSFYRTSGGQGKGYRIMVLNSNDRELVYKIKGQLLSRFPEHAVYMSYQAPFFRLKMGDFIKREDADNFSARLSSIVPRGVFVVPDIVKIRPEDEQKYLKAGENKGN